MQSGLEVPEESQSDALRCGGSVTTWATGVSWPDPRWYVDYVPTLTGIITINARNVSMTGLEQYRHGSRSSGLWSSLTRIEAVVLCPVNDRDEARSCEQRMEDTVRA